MVERRTELNRLYHRKQKLRKLKAKLQAGGADRDKILAKIRRLSPWWTEASLKPAADRAAAAAPAAADEPKKKAPPKPKADKKA